LFAKLSIKLFITFSFILLQFGIVKAQQDTIIKKDTIKFSVDTLKRKTSSDALTSKVEYTCTDSMIFDISGQIVYMYRDAEIKYEEITLTAAYIEINFETNIIYAKGLLDSAGIEYGTPVFIEGEKKFRSKDMTYNYITKKGIIKEMITQEGEGYLHGTKIKKLPNDEILIKSGLYTTCDLDHPHYQIQFKKGKVYPKDKIVTGPADLIVGDVPTPLMIPFGYFPNKKGRSSGIVFPAYGESTEKGFYLQEGGYYFGISDMVDSKLTGNVYSKGSWGMKSQTRYNKRYKFSGNMQLDYLIDKIGDVGIPGYQKTRNFKVMWTHAQDPKSRPNSRFSANVNAGTSQFDKRSLTSNTNAYLSNEMRSDITYSTLISNKFNLAVNLHHDQSNKTHVLNLELPHIAFSTPRFYPLRSKVMVGKYKWYENISVGYTNDIRNSLSTFDTVKFNTGTLQQFSNGMSHTIPISYSMKVMKYFNLTNSFNYTERWYLNTIEKNWYVDPETNIGSVKTDTIDGFKAARDFMASTNLSTKLYGMYETRKFFIKAVRHVLTPSVGFSYNPDFSKQKWGYYKYYVDNVNASGIAKPVKYSIFEKGIYGSPPADESGRVNFAISNNLEMKIRSRKDTITGFKKYVIIDNLSFTTNYDIAKDSLKWAPFTISGRTKLLNHLDVSYMSAWDPYVMDTSGIRYDRFEYVENNRLFRHTSTNWGFNLNYNLTPSVFKKVKTENLTPENDIYKVPWSINISYTLQSTDLYAKPTFKKKNTIIQTLYFSGDISLTPKWKIGASSGYDFVGKKISYTTVNIYRDLHCWEMILNWVPYGARQNYNLTIRVKASVLQDLKLEKKSDNSYTY
jgi:lipopolysaccharide assembly outer membrane protein LptD (OstA)